jgi:HTH-type transcriptional repressor of NAD biosynthesis genes
MKYDNSVLIGKFMPPHYGHVYMIERALAVSRRVHVLVYTMKNEPLPGFKRWKALEEHFSKDSNVVVQWIEKDLPQQPHDHVDFWSIWKNEIEEAVKQITFDKIDAIFGSEDYVKTLGEVLECESTVVDKERKIVPISGTMCREDDLKNWDYIIPEYRPQVVKSVCFVGGESTGKTTLARIMAKVFRTEWVPEYGREYVEKNGDPTTTEEFLHIASHQRLKFSQKKRTSNRLIFADTDCIVTQVFHKLYLGEFSKELDEHISLENYDLYFLLAPVIPFYQDGTRVFMNEQLQHFQMLQSHLRKWKRNFVIIEEEDLTKRIEIVKETIRIDFGLK